MVTKDVLAKFLKLASDRIFIGLDSNKWSGSEKEAALTVLKNRGKDVSKYLEDVPKLQPANSEKLQELSNLITAELSKDNRDMINRIYSLVGDVDNIANLPAETVDYAIASIKEWNRQAKADKVAKGRKIQRRLDAEAKVVKDQVLSEEHKAITDKILADKSLTKKQKVLKMWESGITRTETLALHFMDPTYIYDLHREWLKNV